MKDIIGFAAAIIAAIIAVIAFGFTIGTVAMIAGYPKGERKSVEICMEQHPDYCQTVTTFTTDFKKVR